MSTFRTGLSRRHVLRGAASFAGMMAAPVCAAPASFHAPSIARPVWRARDGALKIGLLWSLTGSLAMIERTCHDVALYWADRVNAAGGLAGFKVKPVIVDARSDIKAYREGVLRLINEHKVLAVFGGYTSASRRAIMPLVELNGGLLFYPAAYPGRECWQRIICTGPLANQNIFDLVRFMRQRHGKRVYMAGSNTVRSREAHRNAANWLSGLGCEIVDDVYTPVDYGDFATTFMNIRAKSPDWIFSTLTGKSDTLFREGYARAGFMPDKMPTASLTTSEMEIAAMGADLGEGHMVSAPYFQSIASDGNRRFVDGFLGSAHGGAGVTHHTMEAAYLSLLYFQKAVEHIAAQDSIEAVTAQSVRDACAGLALSAEESPEGNVQIDADNFNSWLTPKIGRFNSRGQAGIVFTRARPVAPEPFLLYPSRGRCRSDGLHLPHGQVVKSAS